MDFIGTEGCSTMEELGARHKLQMTELEAQIGEMLNNSKKKEKKTMEHRTTQMVYDLKDAQRQEEEALEEYLGTEDGSDSDASDKEKENAKDLQAEIDAKAAAEQEKAGAEAKKIAKAKRKKDKKNAADQKKLVEKEKMSNDAGPSLREIELDALNAKLLSENLVVQEIPSDGNCLYRAVADQLERIGYSEAQKKLDFVEMRLRAAKYMKENPSDFIPFLDLEEGEEDAQFAKYCTKVEQSEGEVEWGGQLEIQAMCKAFKLNVHVYDAQAPVLIMEGRSTEDSIKSGEPLKLAYHRHYYTLGEHYNSVKPK